MADVLHQFSEELAGYVDAAEQRVTRCGPPRKASFEYRHVGVADCLQAALRELGHVAATVVAQDDTHGAPGNEAGRVELKPAVAERHREEQV